MKGCAGEICWFSEEIMSVYFRLFTTIRQDQSIITSEIGSPSTTIRESAILQVCGLYTVCEIIRGLYRKVIVFDIQE